jgi:hypothetical protein
MDGSTRIDFGKYRGKTFDWVITNDPEYTRLCVLGVVQPKGKKNIQQFTDYYITKTRECGTAPARTDEITPAKTDETAPVRTDEITPARTDEITPARTDEITPARTDEITPAKTDETTPAKTDEAAPNDAEFITECKKFEEKCLRLWERKFKESVSDTTVRTYSYEEQINRYVENLKFWSDRRPETTNSTLDRAKDAYISSVIVTLFKKAEVQHFKQELFNEYVKRYKDLP